MDSDRFAIVLGALGERLMLSPFDSNEHVAAVLAFCHEVRAVGQPVAVIRALVARKFNGPSPYTATRQRVLAAVDECFADAG